MRATDQVQEWIDRLQWSDDATPHMKAVVESNLREFACFLDELLALVRHADNRTTEEERHG